MTEAGGHWELPFSHFCHPGISHHCSNNTLLDARCPDAYAPVVSFRRSPREGLCYTTSYRLQPHQQTRGSIRRPRSQPSSSWKTLPTKPQANLSKSDSYPRCNQWRQLETILLPKEVRLAESFQRLMFLLVAFRLVEKHACDDHYCSIVWWAVARRTRTVLQKSLTDPCTSWAIINSHRVLFWDERRIYPNPDRLFRGLRKTPMAAPSLEPKIPSLGACTGAAIRDGFVSPPNIHL